MKKSIVIIGAGAAGCFCTAILKRQCPDLQVTVLEKGRAPMAKLSVTGGGRCNLTNSFAGIRSMKEAYPRGARLMERLMKQFSWEDTIRWFENEGVPLVLQDDNCWFPRSQDAMDIVRALGRGMRDSKVITGAKVTAIRQAGPGFTVETEAGNFPADSVIVTAGGFHSPSGYSFLEGLPVETRPPLPSLYPLKCDDPSIRELTGTVVDATAFIPGTTFKASGPLLITDWGFSGPAILKLSSYAAPYIAERDFRFTLGIRWNGDSSEDETRSWLATAVYANPRKLIRSVHPDGIPSRLWSVLLDKAGISRELRWYEAGAKALNRITAVLCSDTVRISGRFPHREEFVTCGGVSLDSVNSSTLEAKDLKGLFFAGEVLDIDGITGGFNLQAAWTTGYVVAKSIIFAL